MKFTTLLASVLLAASFAIAAPVPAPDHDLQNGGHIHKRDTGKVKWWNAEKGYGFITADKGGDLFAHFSELTGSGFRSLRDGQRVQYVLTKGPKGATASKIRGL